MNVKQAKADRQMIKTTAAKARKGNTTEVDRFNRLFDLATSKDEKDAKKQADKSASGLRGQPQQPSSPIQQFQWPCSQVADEVRQVITGMDLDLDAGREFLCEWYGDLPETDRKQSWAGLVAFAAEYQSQRKKLSEKTKEWCDSGATVVLR